MTDTQNSISGWFVPTQHNGGRLGGGSVKNDWQVLKIRGSNWTDNSASNGDPGNFDAMNRSHMYLSLLVFIGSFVLLSFILYILYKCIKVVKSWQSPTNVPQDVSQFDRSNLQRFSGIFVNVASQQPPPYVEDLPPSYDVAISHCELVAQIHSSKFSHLKPVKDGPSDSKKKITKMLSATRSLGNEVIQHTGSASNSEPPHPEEGTATTHSAEESNLVIESLPPLSNRHSMLELKPVDNRAYVSSTDDLAASLPFVRNGDVVIVIPTDTNVNLPSQTVDNVKPFEMIDYVEVVESRV